MAVPAPTNFNVINPRFEDGTTDGWTVVPERNTGTFSVSSSNPYEGEYHGLWLGNGPTAAAKILNNCRGTVAPGQSITVTGAIGMNDTSDSANRGEVRIFWLDEQDNIIGYASSELIRGNSSSWRLLSVTGTAPAGARYAAPGYWVQANSSGGMRLDKLSWNYKYDSTAQLTHPDSLVDGYSLGTNIPFRVSITGGGRTVQQVIYKIQKLDGVDWQPEEVVATVTSSPYAANKADLALGHYRAFAEVYMSDGTFIVTNMNEFDVVPSAPPDTREYKASNSYTYLIGENFTGLGGYMPPTAIVTGVEVVIGYTMEVLGRVKDRDVDPATSTTYTPFDIVSEGTVEAVLLDKSVSSYSIAGASMTSTIPIRVTDFSLQEEGVTEDKKWVSYSKNEESTVVVGGESLLFGQQQIPVTDFLSKSIGVRFYPTTSSVPSYADSGDACYRFYINTFKVRVYFDAGSVDYFFASPDKSNVIKGTLVAGNVLSGNLKTGDASGVLQLAPELEIQDGSSDFISAGWTIHSGYPVTDLNKIGVVADDMRYNGLPTYYQVESNRSRYLFITANFYGDPNWKSMYGVNGVDRAFTYNGEYFYKIFAHPDADKDKPRHIANHHSHLALGYAEGRVDVSVVGEPYNFDGAKGASSWAFGDSVTGLLPLSGTMLGIFCQKSVWGLSGTTVDNFTSQVISPKMGAIEYTVTDMGFPVYANVYGIYTLSQTTEYGDYKGTPLSQDVSPWLRDRLQRDGTSDKEVVVAWPVRAKNQYKLAFADGYVLTMTMNFGNQQAPTFSKQKYFLTDLGGDVVDVDMYAQPSIVPAAVSSELDHTGKERIHVANKAPLTPPAPPEPSSIWIVPDSEISFLLRLGFDGTVDGEMPDSVEIDVSGDTFEFSRTSDWLWIGSWEVLDRYGEDAIVKYYTEDGAIVLAKGELSPAIDLEYRVSQSRVVADRRFSDYTSFWEGAPLTVRSDTGTTNLEWSEDLWGYYDPTGEYSAFPAIDPEYLSGEGVGYISSPELDREYGAYLRTGWPDF